MVVSNVNKNKQKKFQHYVSYRPLYTILSCLKLKKKIKKKLAIVWQCNSIATIKFAFMSL